LANLSLKFLKFSSVGVATTLFGILSYYILLERMSLPLYPVYAGVWVTAVFISYALNTFYNYKDRFRCKDLLRFYGNYLSALVLGLILLALLKAADLGLSDFILTVLIIIPRFILVFFLVEKSIKKYNSQ